MEAKPSPSRGRLFTLFLFILRAALSAVLASGALLLLVRGRAFFARLNRPDFARVALAAAEIAGAVLFAIPRTNTAGAALLLVVLSWAAGFHFAFGQPAHLLWLFLLTVGVLAVASRAAARQGSVR